jgi:D-alanyl-D-alanine carboxypeptidase/D-alanyl-D-alanine-endopeptidase (penicillin-binding protein 4)
MHQVGPASGAYVYDLTTGKTLFGRNERQRRSPASVEKLYTTSTALLRFGRDGTLTTSVLGSGTQQPGGVFQGDLYLRGGGDPTFGSAGFVRRTYGTGATVQQLVQGLSSQGLTRVQGQILGDESLFDHLRGEPSSGYRPDPFLTGQLSALAFDRGESAPAPNPAALAAQRLAAALRANGVSVTGSAGSARTPTGSLELARAESPPMRTLIKLTNRESDNFFAEMLIKDLGARYGGGGTTVDGAAVVRSQMAHLGLHPHIVDGSGLSAVDHTAPRDVVRLLTVMHGMSPLGKDLEDSLPVAGRTGTLATRMRGTAAQDSCHAKTGTLTDASALAGYCTAKGGDQIAFAFLMNHVSVTTARVAQDRMAEAIASSAG